MKSSIITNHILVYISFSDSIIYLGGGGGDSALVGEEGRVSFSCTPPLDETLHGGDIYGVNLNIEWL